MEKTFPLDLPRTESHPARVIFPPKSRVPFAVFCIAFFLRMPCGIVFGVDPPVTGTIVPPKADDIVSFGSFMMTRTSERTIYLTVEKEKIMEFLTKGEIHPIKDDDSDQFYEMMFMSLPDDVMKSQVSAEMSTALTKYPDARNSRGYFNQGLMVEGAMVTKEGKSFYWKLDNDRLLVLTDEAGNDCLLVLGEDAAPASQFLKAYWYTATTKTLDPATAGKMPVPKPDDIVVFSNHPQRGYGHSELSSPFSENRILKFIREGTPDAELAGHPPAQVKPLIIPSTTMTERAKWVMQNGLRNGLQPKDYVGASGVMTLRDGGMIFWRLLGDTILYMEDARHHTCVLRLGAPDEHVLQYALNGDLYQTPVPDAATLQGPKWKPGDTPPVDEEKAVEIALGELAKIVGAQDLPSWRVGEIQTVVAGDTGYYKVTLTKPIDPEELSLLDGRRAAGSKADAVIFVMMDGKPVTISKRLNGKDAE